MYFGAWALVTAFVYLTLPSLLELPELLRVFAALNAGSFVLVAADKLQAQLRQDRIPELILYVATLFGGSIGMLAGMQLFRHKTRKTSFQFIVGLLVLLQIVLVLGFLTDFTFIF